MFNWLFGKTTEEVLLNQCLYLYPLLSKDEILNVLNNSKDMNKEVELIAALIMETLDEMNEEKRNKLKNELRASNGDK